MKTVLIFIDWFSPGFKAGGPVSSNVNMIAHLKGDFDFKVITRNTDYTETTPYPGIPSDQWIRQEDFDVYYLSAGKLGWTTIRTLVRNTACDTIYINGIYSWYFSILPLFFARQTGKRIIVGARGMLSAHALGVKPGKKALFLKIARFLGLYRQVRFHATHADEAEAIRLLFGKKTEVIVAPNLPKTAPHILPEKEKHAGTLHLVSIARISPEKNTLYALNVLQILGEEMVRQATNGKDPETDKINAGKSLIRFDLYGPVYDQDYWKECETVIRELPGFIQVRYQGSIPPEACEEVLRTSQFLFMPTRGENFGHAILEALQQGCPVIISNCTPWKNLQHPRIPENEVISVSGNQDQEPSGTAVGWDLPLDNPAVFAEVIRYCLLMDQENYSHMSSQAFEYAKKVSSSRESVEATQALFQ